jgi:predicted DNA-binding protein
MVSNKTANLSVQISAQLSARLKTVSEQTRLPVNAIARMAIEAAVEMIERDGGIFLPLQYKRHQAPLDLQIKSKRPDAKKAAKK